MLHRILFLRNGNRVKSLLSINEESREEEEVDPLIKGLIEYEQKMIRQLHQKQNDRPDPIGDKLNVFWQAQGVPLHLVDNQWTLMGEKTLQTIEIVQSEVTKSFKVTADGVQDSLVPLSDQVKVKQSSDTSVSLWYNESFIALKLQTPEDTTSFLSTLEEIFRYQLS